MNSSASLPFSEPVFYLVIPSKDAVFSVILLGKPALTDA
jgi:hypothetical protein